jgi:hypothetical protein
MKTIKIHRILNKTDLGISGKHGCEILLDKSIKSYFLDINANEQIPFTDISTNTIVNLTLKTILFRARKELVNNIQHNIAYHILRVGVTSL